MVCQSVVPLGVTTAVDHPEEEVTSVVAEATSQAFPGEVATWAAAEAMETRCTTPSATKSETDVASDESAAMYVSDKTMVVNCVHECINQ